MEWKEQMNEKYKHIRQIYVGMGGWLILQDYIQTEIIEPLIADIPTDPQLYHDDVRIIKQQLRDKWLKE